MGDREGYTFVEVLVALVLLGITMLSVQAVLTDQLAGTVAREGTLTVANQLAKDRIARIELDPAYHTLTERYEGTESPVDGFPRYARSTRVVRTSTPQQGDFTTVTVRVWALPAGDTVFRTTVVGAP